MRKSLVGAPETTTQPRGRITAAALLAALALGIVAQPVAAIHQNAVLDCGTAGEYTIRTAETGAGIFPPSFIQVDLLTSDGRPAGTLIPFAVSINGVWLQFAGSGYDALSSTVDLSTCTFTGSNGDEVVLVGILNIP